MNGGGMSDLAIPSDGPDVFDGDNFYLKQPNGTLLRLIRYDDHLAALRACEQRLWGEFLEKSQREDVYDRGHAAGRKAARDAVAAVPQEVISFGITSIDRDMALAAIDALRGES